MSSTESSESGRDDQVYHMTKKKQQQNILLLLDRKQQLKEMTKEGSSLKDMVREIKEIY